MSRCQVCNGTGLCPDCSPPGSGKSADGKICPTCNGSGKCPCH
ncbi:MAG: hypothetical protein AB9903_24430 [Vulcanimicrobiota bacterium]